MKVLANDGIATSGVLALEKAGFEVTLKNSSSGTTRRLYQ